jgi:hypothetical protein
VTAVRGHLLASLALAALVGVELVIKYAHVAGTATCLALGGLALANFGGVVAFHMNLRQAPRPLRLLFVLPLALPALFAVALVAEATGHGVRP